MPKKSGAEPKGLIKRPVEGGVNARHERAVEEGLEAIFQNEGGAMPDLKTFEPRRSRWLLYAGLTVAVFVVTLVAAAWAGFSIFKPFRGFSGQGLAMVIEGPERISLGQEVVYFVNYQNRTSEPIAAASVRISFPTDFVVASLDPQPTGEGLVWSLGALPVEGRGTIKIRGTFTGALGTATAIQVVGTYRPDSFDTDFDVLATKVLNYSDSVLVGSLETPPKVLPGDRVVIRYTLENRGQDPFENLTARFTLPEGFQREAVTGTPALDGRVAYVPIGAIVQGASTTVSVIGTFAAGASGEAHVIAEAGHRSNEGSFLASQKTETSFTVLAGDLSLKLVLNGQDQDMTIGYGGVLRFAIGYENTATEDLEDIRIRFRLEQVTPTTTLPSLFDWTSLIEHSSGTRSGDALTWNKQGVAVLGRLPPREDGTIGFTVNALPSTAGASGLVVRAILEAEIRKVGSTTVNRIVRAAPITLRYLSDVDIHAEVRYFSEEGAPLGEGPLPPVVGKTTTYRVEWKVAKTFHELTNLTLRTTLPNGVAWTGKSIDDAGQVVYDPATRSVTWTLNRMPQDITEQRVGFDVALTPGEADADRFAKLLGETRFEATDSVIGETIVRTSPALTTDLENDENASGKGVVRKP
ncbi:MAG: hypothetical protein WC787_01700 [Patescibacteria group bacterium]|jgi:hypothetical protein